VAGAITIAITAGESTLHYYLFNRAFSLYSAKDDPQGHAKHCYVNCMSTRIHAANPVIPLTVSLGKEGADIIGGAFDGRFIKEMKESYGDMKANLYGEWLALSIWKSCQELCKECQNN
jgi:hypothetical protein